MMGILPKLRFLADSKLRSIESFVVDVDGVLTDGSFTYTPDGKISKRFGPEDSDALSLLRDFVRVEVVSADKRGFEISRARVTDMGFELNYVPSTERLEWILENLGDAPCAYMGDSFQDADALGAVAVGISPQNAHPRAKQRSRIVTRASGGSGAVAEACGHIARSKNLDLGVRL